MCWCGVLCLGRWHHTVSRQYEYISQRSACLCFVQIRRTGFSSGNRGVNLSRCFVILAAGSQANGWAALTLPIFGLTGGSFVAGLASWGSLWAVNKFGVSIVRAATTTKFFWACWHRCLCPDYRSDEITRG